MSIKYLCLLVIITFNNNSFSQNLRELNDSIINSKFVNEEENLVLAKLKNPLKLCRQLKRKWEKNSVHNVEVSNAFQFENDSTNFYLSFVFEILKNGKVLISEKKSFSKFDSICKEFFKPEILNSDWMPSFYTTKKCRKYKKNSVIIYFLITRKGVQNIAINDLKTSRLIFNCRSVFYSP